MEMKFKKKMESSHGPGRMEGDVTGTVESMQTPMSRMTEKMNKKMMGMANKMNSGRTAGMH